HVAVAQEVDGVFGDAARAVESVRLQLLGTVQLLAVGIALIPAAKLIRIATHTPPVIARLRPPSWAQIPLADHRGDAEHVQEASAPRLAPERAGQRVNVRVDRHRLTSPDRSPGTPVAPRRSRSHLTWRRRWRGGGRCVRVAGSTAPAV